MMDLEEDVNIVRPVLLRLQDDDDDEEDEDPTFEAVIPSKPILLQLPADDDDEEDEDPTFQAVVSSKPVLLRLPTDDDDEEDEDAPLPIANQLTNGQQESTEPLVALQSEECAEALQAVESDCWDINSWILFIDEVEAGRGGEISVPDAYHRFLGKFPCAAKQWKALAEYHTKRQEFTLADEVYSKCLSKCRNVELWLSYVHMVRLKSPVDGSQRLIEATFEKALGNVGMSILSNPLWTAYIEFIRSWPESDAGRKLGTIILIYRILVWTHLYCLFSCNQILKCARTSSY